jgi:arginyl-tRNA synthetase
MADGDEEVLSLWSRMRKLSVVEYKKMYARLGIAFDFYGGESVHAGEEANEQLRHLKDSNLLTTLDETIREKANAIYEERVKRGIDGSEESDWQEAIEQSNEDFVGKYIEFPEESKLGKILLTKKDGSTLYITRDIAAAVSRYSEHHFDKMIYVVAVQQNLHFSQLFKILEMAGHEWAERCQHVSFGMVQGMSTRKGNVIFLSDILDDAKEVMLEQMKNSERSKMSEISDPETTADIVGMSAVFIQDMSGRREKGYVKFLIYVH